MSEVENIRHIVNKNVASYTSYTDLVDININFITGVAVFCQNGPQLAPKAKKGGAQALFRLDCSIYIPHITLQRGGPGSLVPPG